MYRLASLRRVALPAALLTAVLTLGILGSAAPAQAAEDGPEVTWGVRTAASAQGDGRENYAYEADPGEIVEDAIIIANHDDAPLTLDIYAADGFTTSSGQLDVATRDVVPREIGAWLVPAADRVTIAPGDAVEVPFTISVPSNATPGDHAGGILTTLTSPPVEDGVTVDRRLGIRIHLRVTGELAPTLAIEDLHLDHIGTANPFATGDAVVAFTVRNTGNTRLTAGQTVALTGPFGLFRVDATDLADLPELPELPELLPGESWPVEVRLTGVVPAFVLDGTVTLTPPDDAPQVTATVSTIAIPWTLLALVALMATAIGVWIMTARRRRAVRTAREDARVQEAVAQALRERTPVA